MKNSTFVTKGGIKIEKSITPLKSDQALNKIYQYIDLKKRLNNMIDSIKKPFINPVKYFEQKKRLNQ